MGNLINSKLVHSFSALKSPCLPPQSPKTVTCLSHMSNKAQPKYWHLHIYSSTLDLSPQYLILIILPHPMEHEIFSSWYKSSNSLAETPYMMTHTLSWYSLGFPWTTLFDFIPFLKCISYYSKYPLLEPPPLQVNHNISNYLYKWLHYPDPNDYPRHILADLPPVSLIWSSWCIP